VVDGSPDSTLPLLENLTDKIKYFYQAPRGVSAARNHGIQQATGEYIALLDADDVWLAGKLEKQIAFLKQHPDVGFSFSTVWNLVDTDGMKIPGEPFFPPPLRRWMAANERLRGGAVKGSVYDLFLDVNCVATSSLVIRREVFDAIGCFDESLRNAEDYELELRLAKRSPAIFIEEPTSRYRVHDTGLSGAWLARSELFHRTNLAALEKHYSSFPTAAVRKAIAETCASYASYCLNSGQMKLAASLSRRSLWLHPTLPALKYCAEASAPAIYGWIAGLFGKGDQLKRTV
jgi:glycosyltransferase involved in cell wall biosynthesis